MSKPEVVPNYAVVNVVLVVVLIFWTTTGTTWDNLIFCCQCCLGCRFIFDDNRDNLGQLDFFVVNVVLVVVLSLTTTGTT